MPAEVISSVPETPRVPVPDDKFIFVPVKVNDPLLVMLPAPLAARVIVVAELAPSMEMLPSDVVAKLNVLPAEKPDIAKLPVSVTYIEPVVDPEILVVFVWRAVPAAPISPEVDIRFNVVAVRVTLPERVIVPEPLAVRFMVPAEELAVITMPPFAAVFRLKDPLTVDAPRLTEFVSSTYAEPDVLKVKVPAVVNNAVPEDPISPDVDARLIVVALSVELAVRVMVPEPLAVRNIVLAETLLLTEILPFAVVAISSTLPAENVDKPMLPVSRI